MSSKKLSALAAVALLMLAAQPGGRAQGTDGAPSFDFATSFSITGNYVVGGVDLAPSGGSGGFVTGTIPISGVPANADVLAAFLYWETIWTDESQFAGARFRGEPLDVVRRSESPLDSTYAPCWSSGGAGGAYKMTMFRADVRRLLPVQLDANGNPTGKRLVNDADLLGAGFPLHTVTLPEAGTGNQVPQSAGASLFVVYRDPAQPLTKVVLYDGIRVQTPGATTTHTLRGFLQSSANPVAKITHIAGSGANNATDRLLFGHNGTSTLLAQDAFQATASPSSDRAWSNPTYTVSSLMPGADPGLGYGEEVSTTVDHANTSPYDCLAWAAIAFSTTVQDTDKDGLVDKLEDSSGLKDPNGHALPDIHAMGASSTQRDLFLEVGAMRAAEGTTYGSATAPFSATIDAITDANGHNHMPTPAVLKMVGDALASAPAMEGGSPGIRLHVDVGTGYHSLGAEYASLEADPYLITAEGLARGGETILETACVEDLAASPPRTCLFPDYPGTVGWKAGFQLYRDARVGDDGQELSQDQLEECQPDDPHEVSACERRRFDPTRLDIFHYALYAHAGGIPKSPLACLNADGVPTAAVAPLSSGAPCGDMAPNPAFHVPSTSSGRGDLPGGDFMVTLGLWDTEKFVGTDFVRASTTLHELGHNLERWHGGDPPTFTPVTVNDLARVKVAFEPNCKPNYLSAMSYLFQINGLVDDAGVRHIDYSGAVLGPAIDETAPTYGSLPVPLPYRTSWFAPLVPGTLGATLGTKAAKKYCGGQSFPTPLPGTWVEFARIDAASTAELIDWNADGVPNETAQDVNFDGTLVGGGATPATPGLRGANDWAGLRLNQVGSRRNIAGFSSGHLGGYVDGGYVDGGYVDGGYVDGGYVDGGYVDGGYVDGGYVDGGYVDGGYVDGGYVDGGYVDGGYVDGGAAELTFEESAAMGYAPPAELRACVIGEGACVAPDGEPDGRVRLDWKFPHAGNALRYFIYRVQGPTVTPVSTLVPVEPAAGVPSVDQPTYTLVDGQELPDGVKFTYLAKAQFEDGPDDDTEPDLSIPSNYATITAVSRPPQAALAVGLTPGAAGWFTTAPVGVTFTATDDWRVSAVACTDNGLPVAGTVSGLGTGTATSSFSVSGDGTHALSCSATDAAGNTATAGGTVRIDTVAPETVIDSGPGTGGTTTPITFHGVDATSGVASFECRWDSGPFFGCTSPISTSGLSADPHMFSVRAVDMAGNVDATPATWPLGSSTTGGYVVTPLPITVKTSAQLGSAVPIVFQVKTAAGAIVTTTSVVERIESVYQGPAVGGRCPGSATGGTVEVLYQRPDFSTGKSSLRYVSGGFQFNWDSTSASTLPIVTGKGCYVALVYLDDKSAAKPTTPLLLK